MVKRHKEVKDGGSIRSGATKAATHELKRGRCKRLAALTLSSVLLAGAAPLLSASPAAAWAQDCRNYLRSKGYRVPVPGKANTACGYAQDYGTGKQRPQDAYLLAWCGSGLRHLGVKKSHAKTACWKGTLV
ncbi:hypothetical protein [Streptomyces platensis]|uniref:hypothetical protein n=1 Tax=Streptomyces platensis TaxID=58346 RepID=UPI003791FD2B